LAPIWVWLAFGETPRTATLIGGLIVFAAVFAHVLVSASGPSTAIEPV
jgi:drug/metabolite transporter (DMT)-like permease